MMKWPLFMKHTMKIWRTPKKQKIRVRLGARSVSAIIKNTLIIVKLA
jgi:hypothetical protein